MDPNAVFSRIAQLRQELNLPNAQSKAPYVFAILYLGPHEVYGMNTYGVDGRAAGLPRETRQFLNQLSGAAHADMKRFSFGSTGSLAHAEGDALATAYSAGYTSQHKIGTLFVDKPVCGLCRGTAGLPRLLGLIGMQEVSVYELQQSGQSYKIEREP